LKIASDDRPPLARLAHAFEPFLVRHHRFARAVYSEIMGCESGCDVVAAGWPLPYLADYPGISVVGAANLAGALLGEDRLRWLPFALTWLFWTAVSAGAFFLWARAARRPPPRG
jgi:hypothetical protein